jgi:kynurenine formamidase
MELSFTVKGVSYTFDSAKPLNIALPLKNAEDNPNCYYANPVVFEIIRMGDFTGSTAEGGPVNHKQITLAPHGNGTHTECYGHISSESTASINLCLQEYLFLAQLISIYPAKKEEDHVISLSDVVGQLNGNSPEALIIRTLPNDHSKMTRQYSGTNPPYLEPELCTYLATIGVKHLLVDLPSVDKEVDEGLLLAHKNFWHYPFPIRKDCTITELVYISNYITDGVYFLNLQILNIDLDASPSQPILFKLISEE